jgi:hypothetical protein
MSSGGHSAQKISASDVADAQPTWMRTGYKFFPYATQQSGQWWVLRFNYGFPDHEMYTLFVDTQPVVDITGDSDHPVPLVRNIASLKPFDSASPEPMMDADLAETVVSQVARYVIYGSEHNEPGIYCSENHDGMARI